MDLELAEAPDLVFQTDKLPELQAYIKQEGMLLKGEALDVIDALFLARKQLREIEQSGCARHHLAEWKRNLDSLVRICNEEPPHGMRLDRAREVLSMMSMVTSAMLGQIVQEQRATQAAEAG